jgi:hypothetical protein
MGEPRDEEEERGRGQRLRPARLQIGGESLERDQTRGEGEILGVAAEGRGLHHREGCSGQERDAERHSRGQRLSGDPQDGGHDRGHRSHGEEFGGHGHARDQAQAEHHHGDQRRIHVSGIADRLRADPEEPPSHQKPVSAVEARGVGAHVDPQARGPGKDKKDSTP